MGGVSCSARATCFTAVPKGAFLPYELRKLTLNLLWGYLEERGMYYNSAKSSNVQTVVK